jgi:8-oxo-dGTP pyrophosphatase MutT (NUDIX family)
MTVSDIRNAFQTYKRKELPCTHKRRSAALVPFFMHDEEMYLLFTERTEMVERHKREISFPGGMCEPDDADAVATALREAQEEIGLPPLSVNVR